MRTKKQNPKGLVQALLAWYHAYKRDLPWRRTRDPYAIWISETMLQQTQVKTTVPYYHAFLKKFPTIESLAKAELQDVLKSWEGLGYYSRARNLHSTANEVRSKYGGKFPKHSDDLRSLPGIGPYTANAVASIAFGEPVPVVDGNVWRVFSRILADNSPPLVGRKKIYDFLLSIIPSEDPSSFNQAIMELGALICTPKNPKCSVCPVSAYCKAFQEKRISEFPQKKLKKILPVKHWMTLVLLHENKVLMQQRASSGLWGGLWECPTIPLVKTRKENQIRQLAGEHGASKDDRIKKLNLIRHTFSHFKLVLHPYLIRMSDSVRPQNTVWSNFIEPDLPLPKPYLMLLKDVRRLYPAFANCK